MNASLALMSIRQSLQDARILIDIKISDRPLRLHGEAFLLLAGWQTSWTTVAYRIQGFVLLHFALAANSLC